MSNNVFPLLPGITYKTTWTVMFRTNVLAAVSGAEFRASLMANPIYNITLNFEFLRTGPKAELQKLAGFYMQCKGRFENFLIIFDDDCAVVNQQIGIGNGSNRYMQLIRAFGGSVEPVQNINVITSVKVDGHDITDYTVSDTGLLTFAVAPVGLVTWTGSYYYRARFESDDQDFEKIMGGFYEAKSIKLVGSLGRRI